MQDSKPKIITFCSGKNGVGKSIIAANVAYELSNLDINNLLCDFNLSSPTLHLLLGVEPVYFLQELPENSTLIDKTAIQIQENMKLIAGTTSLQKEFPITSLRASIEMIITTIVSECIIFDCNSGVGSEVIECCRISDFIFVVITDDPSSIIDAYGLIKIIQASLPNCTIRLIVNNVIDVEDADDTTNKLNLATTHFLASEYESLGFIPYDRTVKMSLIQQQLLGKYSPYSPATLAIRQISTSIKEMIASKMEVEVLH